MGWCGCIEIIIASVPCLVAIMTINTIDRNFIYQQIAAPTPRSILMVPKTHMPYHHKVSHGVRYRVVMGAVTVPLVRGTMYCSGG